MENSKLLLSILGDQSDSLDQFNQAKEIDQRFTILYNQLKEKDIFSNTVNGVIKDGKDELESERLRSEGNSLYQKGKFRASIDKFSAAATKAPFQDKNQSRSFSLAIANRSLALLKLGYHEEAIRDIDLAIESGYPDNNKQKLLERREKCCEEFRKKKKKTVNRCHDVNTLTLNTNVPVFQDSVKIEYSPERGRYGVATRDLMPGDVVLQEKPLASVLKPQYRKQYCDTCCGRAVLAPVACQQCCHVTYCSVTCRDVSWSRYHQHECGHDIAGSWEQLMRSSGISSVSISSSHHQLCFRIVSGKSLQFWRDNGQQLLAQDNLKGTGGQTFLPRDYNSFYSLVSHSDTTSDDVKESMLVSACFQVHALAQSGYVSGADDMMMLAEVIVRTLLVMRYNTHAIIETVLTQDNVFSDVRSLGCGAYPGLCLLNTSCDQNITKYHVDHTVVGVVSQLIRAGEEVSDNYYPTAFYMPREERREWLEQHYMFTCECNACSQDTPLVSAMPDTPVRILCQSCGDVIVTEDDPRCHHCGEMTDFDNQCKLITKVVDDIMSCTRASHSDPDSVKFYEDIKKHYCDLRALVAYPYKYLVFAEQQFLKSMKQVFGNRVIRK